MREALYTPQYKPTGKEVAVIEQFTQMRESIFSTNLAEGATFTATKVRGAGFEPANLIDGNYDSYFATGDGDKTVDIEITLAGEKTFNRVMLQEYIPLGQRVKSFTVQYKKNGSWTTWKSGTTIGYKRILLGSTKDEEKLVTLAQMYNIGASFFFGDYAGALNDVPVPPDDLVKRIVTKCQKYMKAPVPASAFAA